MKLLVVITMACGKHDYFKDGEPISRAQMMQLREDHDLDDFQHRTNRTHILYAWHARPKHEALAAMEASTSPAKPSPVPDLGRAKHAPNVVARRRRARRMPSRSETG